MSPGPIRPWVHDTVRLRLDETGTIVIGPEQSAVAGLEHVGVIGAALYIDLAAPEQPPLARVPDIASATTVVSELYGEGVAQAAAQLSASGRRGHSVDVALATSATLRDLQQLATLRWLRHTVAGPFDSSVGVLELALVTQRCRTVLDEDLDDWYPLDTVLTAALEAAPIMIGLRDAGGVVVRLVEDALDAAAVHLTRTPVNRSLLERCAQALAGLAPDAGTNTAGPDLDTLLADLAPTGALTAGLDGHHVDVVAGGSAPVDWERTDGRVVSRREGAATWLFWSDGDGDQFDITVRGAQRTPSLIATLRDPRPQAPPTVAVFAPSWPLPLAQTVTTPDEQDWSGTLAVAPEARSRARDAADDGTLVIDVRSPGAGRVPRRGDEAVADEALRWGARGVWLARSASGARGPAADTLREAAADAFHRAQTIWADLAARGTDPRPTVGHPTEADHPASAYAAQIARCQVLVAALANAAADPSLPTGPRQFGTIAAPAQGPTPVDVSDPGWHPSAAELLADRP